MDSFDSTLLVTILFAYLLARQSMHRVVTRRDFILPAAGALYLAARYLGDGSGMTAALLWGGAVAGIFTGLIAGSLVDVGRDEDTGLIYQHGGWRYALVLLSLLLVRVLVHVVTSSTGAGTTAGVLNDALIALALGNYLGRTLHVGARALQLLEWDPRRVPSRRTLRRVRSPRGR